MSRSVISRSIIAKSAVIFLFFPALSPAAASSQAVQRALSCERLAAAPSRLEASEHGSESRIAAQPVMVIEILVSQQKSDDPLPGHAAAAVDSKVRVPCVAEAGGQPVKQVQPLLGEPDQQGAGVGGQGSAGEIGLDAGLGKTFRSLTGEFRTGTDCCHGETFLRKPFLQ